MIKLSDTIVNFLQDQNKYVVPVVEFYSRKESDITSVIAPANAIGRFSIGCFEWNTTLHSHKYLAKVNSFPSIEVFQDGELNTAEIEFSNVERGENSMSRFVLNNHVKGMWMVIRLIFPDLKDTSHVVFWGKCERPGGINTETISITAKQDLGNSGQKIPFRTYSVNCPLEFAKPFGGCLGNQTLEEKSPAFRQAVATYGTAGCNKLFTTCSVFGNTNYFQGQQVVAVSGQFSYVTIEEVVKRVLFWTKRKKIRKVKTDNWSSVNQSEGDETIPFAFGRCQIEGHPIVWADVGEQVKALYGVCEGKISAFTFTKSRVEGISILQVIEHLGDWGGVGTQTPDTLFGGVSGVHSRLAYLEITTNGSSPTQVDDAPLITTVVRGVEIPVPDANGEFTIEEWSNNPVAILRFLLTDVRFGRMPVERIDDVAAYDTFLDCDEIVEDRTNEETIVLPANEYDNYDAGYRRFRSTGRYSAFRDMYEHQELPDSLVPVDFPDFEHPEIRWFNPFQQYLVPVRQNVLRQKYTCNGAVQEETSLLDFIYEKILPTFKGYLNYSHEGKVQIRNRRKADNAYLRADIDPNRLTLPITNISPWRNDYSGYIVIGVSKEEAEVRKVVGYLYSAACEGLNIDVTTASDTLIINSVNITGAGTDSAGLGYIQFDGTPTAGDVVTGVFDSGDAEFTITYTADGVENLNSITRMYAAFLNANLQFKSYLTAYILPEHPHRIVIRCELGSLILDQATEFEHSLAEEIIRVQTVFENCGELTANTSARFDNLLDGTFKWNENNTEEVNAITARYTSAVDDFRTTILTPRAAWDTIDLEGELVKDEIDLTFVDNYWQAAYLAKGEAIDRIDGNLHFSFSTNFEHGLALEMGDVVAVRHDSGDGALNYVPAWITKKSINLDDFTIELEAKLYLSAAFDYRIAPIDPLLTTTLNTAEQPPSLPPTVGTNGGVGGGTEPVVIEPNHNYSKLGITGKYSPSGRDIV